jgi:hypothetical protein
MASSSDPWVKEYNEASRLADDINSMIAERGSLPQSGPEIMRHTSAIRRKITILGTRLDSLVTLLSKIPPKSLYVLFLQLLYYDTMMYIYPNFSWLETQRKNITAVYRSSMNLCSMNLLRNKFQICYFPWLTFFNNASMSITFGFTYAGGNIV